ncbi:hypothetical protein [Mycobacterium florentinum]|uniref:hypothetical protein n=1 Tax=Mycobacterium florentinum TaxID=292462 RepID=UPI00111C2AEE|nr:hypothetical protein [Mycobacterium florentinum]MCV7413536.1 hypothetical protein [Mycobacterium florentinum]BBX77078.1 hypothetical protein MFLOJ_08650 [Mycobacterium florentinum]
MTIEFNAADLNNVRGGRKRLINNQTRVEPDAPLVGDDESDPRATLTRLISRQADAVAQMRRSMPVYFAGDGFPYEVIVKRRRWSRGLEEQWASVVGACMNLGYLDKGDPLIAARLILGMIMSVGHRCQPAERVPPEQITHAIVTLLGFEPGTRRSAG